MRGDRVFNGRALELLAAVPAAPGGLRQLFASDRFAAADTPVEHAVGGVEVGVVVAVVSAVVDCERVAVHQLLDFDVIERRQRCGVLRGPAGRSRQEYPDNPSRERLQMHAASGESIAVGLREGLGTGGWWLGLGSERGVHDDRGFGLDTSEMIQTEKTFRVD